MNRFITWFTRSSFYHVAICEDEFHVIEARPKGVIRRDLRTQEGGHWFVVVPPPADSGERALQWAVAHLGAGYDRLDVAVIVLERVFKHLHVNYTPRNKFSCGEFVAMAFAQTGTNLFPGRAPAGIVPGDFAALLPPDALRQADR